MRGLLLAAMMFGAVQGAQAADMPDFLRGSLPASPAPSRNWEGWYVGGEFGYSGANLDFSHASQSLTNFMLRNSVLQEPVSQWALLEAKNANGTGFGGFVGKNWQWEDAVLGFEVNYSNIRGVSGSSGANMRLLISPSTDTPPPGHTYSYNTYLEGTAAAQIKDVMTLRARAGWDAGGFMPYLFGGVAIGRLNVSRTATLDVTRYDDYTLTTNTISPTGAIVTTSTPQRDTKNVSPIPATKTEGGVDSITGGYTVGLGTEMKVFGDLFVRAEWEYVKFLKVKDVATSMNSARFGVGYKF